MNISDLQPIPAIPTIQELYYDDIVVRIPTLPKGFSLAYPNYKTEPITGMEEKELRDIVSRVEYALKVKLKVFFYENVMYLSVIE